MKLASTMHNERRHDVILASIVFAAFAVRLAALFFTISIPGDGPARATRAYVWAQSPFFHTTGVWLRGYEYLVGIFGYFLGDPLFTARFLNVLLGTCTVLVFSLLVRRVFDPVTGLISGAVLAFFPLHIGLSAGTLSELSFAFEVVAGVFFLIVATEAETTKGRSFSLVVSLVFLSLAAMTRYEAWALIPVFPCYYYWKTRRLSSSLMIAAVLAAFPLTWTLHNYFLTGGVFRGFTRATGWHHGVKPVGLVYAVRVVIGRSLYHLGWIVPVSAVVGVGMQFSEALKRRVDARKVLYMLMTCIFWAGVLAFALARGLRLWDRYLLFAFLVALPFAALPLSSYYSGREKKRPFVAILMTVILVASVVYKPGVYDSLSRERNSFYVTLWRPQEVKRLADWLKKSPYRDSPVLLTRLHGQAAYLSFFFPEASSRRFIVKNHATQSGIAGILEARRPALFITDRHDEIEMTVETILGVKLGQKLVHTEGFIRVYDISSAVNAHRF